MFTCPGRRKAEWFHVSIHDLAGEFRIMLAGRFTGAETPEVEGRWRTAASIIGGKSFLIGLEGVTYVDPTARELLIRMHEAGAQFIAASREARGIVDGITGDARLPEKEGRGIRRMIQEFAARLDCLALRLKIRAV